MKFKSLFAAFSITVLLTGCQALNGMMGAKDAPIEITDLGIVAMVPEGYTMQKVADYDIDTYRIYNGTDPVVDFESQEFYDLEGGNLKTIEEVLKLIDSWWPTTTILKKEQGEYGASILYETPEFFAVLSGIEDGETKVICQTAEGALSEKIAFEICKNSLPKRAYDEIQAAQPALEKEEGSEVKADEATDMKADEATEATEENEE